jgi:hypothetical protein
MAESFARGDKLVDRGTPMIDASRDLCPGNVGGMIVSFPFVVSVTKTDTNADGYYNDVASSITRCVMPKAGSVVGISVQSKAAVAKGYTTFKVLKGTTDITSTGLICTLNSAVAANTRTASAFVNKDLHTFAAGQPLGITVDCGASVTTNTFGATIFVEM